VKSKWPLQKIVMQRCPHNHAILYDREQIKGLSQKGSETKSWISKSLIKRIKMMVLLRSAVIDTYYILVRH